MKEYSGPISPFPVECSLSRGSPGPWQGQISAATIFFDKDRDHSLLLAISRVGILEQDRISDGPP